MLNPETSIVCVDCGITYTMPDQEYARFKELAAKVANFRMPRRCSECRRARRNQATPAKTAVSPVVQGYHPALMAVAPAQAVTTPPAVSESLAAAVPVKAEGEVLLVLATKDFDELVHGQPIVWRGVRVVLADIGFDSMRKVIDDAELQKAKKLVKANGH